MKINLAELRSIIREELLKETTFNVKDRVIPLVGPHKGIPHEIIAVHKDMFADGAVGYGIKPILQRGMKNKYHLGAAMAKEEDLRKEK